MKKFLLALFITALPNFVLAKPVWQEEKLTQDEIKEINALITENITPCWEIPAITQLKPVRLNIDVEEDGLLKFAGFPEKDEYSSDKYYQLIANSAHEAMLDPKCNQLKQLPYMTKFSQWRKLTIIFNPRFTPQQSKQIIDDSVSWPSGL